MKKRFITFLLSIWLITISGAALAEVTEKDPLYNAKKHFSFAVQHKNNKDFELALEQYKLSISYVDTVYQVHFSFADLLLKMGLPLEARREYSASLKLNPSHSKSASILAKMYHESAEYDSALAMYEVVYRLEPENLEILAGIANLRDYLGKKTEALETYEKLIDHDEVSYEILMRASSLALSLDEFEKARSFLTLVLKKHSDDLDALKNAASACLAMNDPVAASLHLRRIAETDSTDISSLIRLEDIYRRQNDTGNLIWALELHLGVSPQDCVIIGELCEMLFREGNTKKGLEYMEKGLNFFPGDGKLRILMGEYYRSCGETEKALRQYEIALRDSKWRASAQEFIWQIKPPETEEEKAEREFFNSGKVLRNGNTSSE